MSNKIQENLYTICMKILFSKNLKLLRKEYDISQQKLSDMVGVTQQCISEWENGKIEPTLTYLWKLADIFGMTIDELVGKDN